MTRTPSASKYNFSGTECLSKPQIEQERGCKMKRRITLITIIGVLLLAVHMTAGAESVFSGSCGENITYSLDDTGVLTITGTGPITSHIWNDYYNAHIADQIKSVYI